MEWQGGMRMSQRDKGLESLRRNASGCRIEELEKHLRHYGFEKRAEATSHFAYKHGGLGITVVVPFNRPIKPIYVQRVLDAIDRVREYLNGGEEG